MSYTITNTRGATIALVNDNTLNAQTDLQLIGRSYTNFGSAFNKNLVRLMENFANPTAPSTPLEGELWWSTTNKTLSVYNGTAWANIVPIADTITVTNFNATYGNITNQNAGTINATNLYSSVIGNTGAAISGATLSLTGTSTLNTITATSVSAGTIGNASATIQGGTIQSLGGGQITGYHTGAIGANAANTGAFTTVTASSVTTTGGGQVTGYLTGAIGANTANSGVFTTVTTTSGGQVTGYITGAIGANVANTGAFTTVSASGALSAASVTTTGGGQVTGYHTGAIGANTANTGAFTTVTTTGSITVNSTSGVSAILNGGTSGVGNIGASGNTFNTVFAKATTAQYADVAEKYLADAEYPAGTVVIFGGEKEITISTIHHDPVVAGVISTDPAYLMNSESEGLPVALLGRVPCLVKGPVNVGDRVVTSYISGTAMRLDIEKYQPGCIIGKSLGTIVDDSIQTIEVVVGRN